MLVCRLFGHRWRFSAEDETMHWVCTRGCGASGEKRYESAERAARYARALDREDRDDLGPRPLLSLLPLGLTRRAPRRAERGQWPLTQVRSGGHAESAALIAEVEGACRSRRVKAHAKG